jgi:site-specific DNA-methyltransferase (adenine-specific)
MNELLEVYNDDCFNIFPKIKDNSIDLFILDLPYANKKFGNCTACKWDTPIDLGKMWIEIKRIMKPKAVLCFFCNTKFGFTLIESNPKWFKYDLIWKKSRKVGFLSANKRQLRNHENIYVFGDKTGTYNPQKVAGEPYDKMSKGTNIDCFNGTYYETTSKYKPVKNDGYRHPCSVIEHENVYVFGDKTGTYNPQKVAGEPYTAKQGTHTDIYGKQDEGTITENKGDRHPCSVIEHENTILEYKSVHKTIHRTEKPVGLLEYLIKSYSNEGDTVMDFTMGSGSTGEACINTNRRFIGVEKDDDIFIKAVERLS